jgi:hypothetical protein
MSEEVELTNEQKANDALLREAEDYGVAPEPVEMANISEPKSDTDSWFTLDGIAGEGDKPEFLQNKFKSLEAQAVAYNELEKRFGSFVGAPEEYEIPEMKEKSFIFEPEHPQMKQFIEMAKGANMSQEVFNKCLDNFVDFVSFGRKEPEDIMGALGENAEQQLSVLNGWISNNFTEQEASLLDDIKGSGADYIRLLQKMRGKTMEQSVPTPAQSAPMKKQHTQNDLVDMMKDSRFRGTYEERDRSFIEKVNKIAAQLKGLA